MKAERLLQTQGFGTRKTCRALIRAGAFSVAGECLDDPFAELSTAAPLHFEVDGQAWTYREKAYLALHKPAGYECSRKPLHHPAVFELLPGQLANRDVQCVGRLDQDTTGLLLLSDDGQFIHQWSSGKKQVPKVYRVTTRHPVNDSLLAALREGVQLHDEPAPIRAFACEQEDSHVLRLTVTEGKYHQVKRMVAAAGNRVEALCRIQIGGLALPAQWLPGTWHWLAEADLASLARFSTEAD